MANHTDILRHARITPKRQATPPGDSVYVFDVATSATKRDILRAVQTLYKVKPVKIRVASVPTKQVRHARTGILGTKGGGRKAYVYLKKGETITLS